MKISTSPSLFHRFILISILLVSVFQKSNLLARNNGEKEKKIKTHKKNELAVVAIFRDEARFLTEWIEYYRLHGVSKFYLYNNLSQDDYQTVLRPYVKRGIVSLHEWDKESFDSGYWNHVQVTAYAHGMSLARSENVSWLIVIDTDEFLVPLEHETLLDFVRAYDHTDVGILSVFWMMFGTSGVKEIPTNKLMLEMLQCNGGPSLAIGEKSILHTQRADTDGPHHGLCHEGYKQLTLPLELIQINHYWSRDERFFYEVKVPRRIKWGWNQEQSENFMNTFNSPEFPGVANSIQRYVPALRKAVFKKRQRHPSGQVSNH